MRWPAESKETHRRAAAGRLLAVVLVSMLVVSCDDDREPASAAKRQESRSFSPGQGTFIDIGDDRSLRMWCAGSGKPTVVVSAGVIDRSAGIRDELARTARTCAYDRAGEGYSSEHPDLPSDARDDLQDLRKLLAAADLESPYVLVGFSYESPVVSLFAEAHPRQAAGVVLVEGVGANWRRRFLALGRGQPAAVRRRLRHDVGPAVAGGLDADAIGAQAASVKTLGTTPLAVVSTRFAHGAPPSVRPAAARLWMAQQDELAALSSNHLHVVATRTDEFVMSTQSQVVVRAVRAVVEAARTGKPLPTCTKVFDGPGVRCRG